MKLSLASVLLALAPACLAQDAAPASTLATITMRDPAALEVSYRIAPSCPALAFRNDGFHPGVAASLRKDWAAADACTEFDGKEVRRKHPSCSTLRLRVPATTRSADRVYPWAYPVERGLYVHTSAYAPTDACGPVEWEFVVPDGTVVIDGRTASQRAARSAADGGGEHMPTVLIRQRFASGAVPRVYASSEFAPATQASLAAKVGSIESELRLMLPGLAITVPFIVASPSEPGTYWGDVANRTVMRLSFPPAVGPEQEQLLHSFVAHEMAHITQPADWNDSWKEDSATIGEGGAEFLRVVAATRLGWFDRVRLQGELEQAVNGCLLAANGKPWKAMRNRNWGTNPYQCGLTFHLLGLAGGQAPQPALLRLRDYYARAKGGLPTDFARAVECGAAAGCDPRWLPRLAGEETLDDVLLDYTRHPGAVLRPTEDIAPVLVKPIAFWHLGLLMSGDCKGSISMYHEAAAARIAEGPACGVLRPGMVVVGAEGLPLFEGSAAVKASIQACATTGKTVLGLRDGRSIALACDATVKLPARLYRVDVDRALALAR
ncbi:hypothetical protein [Massilia sp. SYSU DXS3249]